MPSDHDDDTRARVTLTPNHRHRLQNQYPGAPTLAEAIRQSSLEGLRCREDCQHDDLLAAIDKITKNYLHLLEENNQVLKEIRDEHRTD